AAGGDFREPGFRALAFEVEQAQVAQIGELAAHGVQRQGELDVGEHPPDYLLRDRDRTSRVDDAQHPPSRFLAALLFEINCVRHTAFPLPLRYLRASLRASRPASRPACR